MTRYVVFREGTNPLPDTFVTIGSLKPPDREWVPVVYAFDFSKPPIGRAKDFERDETGAISFDIEFHDDLGAKVAREECFSIAIYDMVIQQEGELREVVEGTIKVIAFMPLPGFPPSKNSQDLHGS